MSTNHNRYAAHRAGENSEEVNFKKNFCERYFNRQTWSLDVLNQVDVLLCNRRGEPLLYIETKFRRTNEVQRRAAIAQAVLTNKKQEQVFSLILL